ncbi:hypothetical protein PV359_11635 [Streptomyces stelliscabiei]|nr:hypothetical protein [Streptomyces stelliscabiei]MDX2520613.1 hypothetical protein [Streptomyces stelliscabiei]MDX2552710.1 hypothetical protein [Streptomyces stelliscabiei]MDX2661394.1 hypothetical protein [Streptomyces stelliscabiei]MDX2788875.1 hypothetical protein [Streptomyces stelliscabiei]
MTGTVGVETSGVVLAAFQASGSAPRADEARLSPRRRVFPRPGGGVPNQVETSSDGVLDAQQCREPGIALSALDLGVGRPIEAGAFHDLLLGKAH